MKSGVWIICHRTEMQFIEKKMNIWLVISCFRISKNPRARLIKPLLFKYDMQCFLEKSRCYSLSSLFGIHKKSFDRGDFKSAFGNKSIAFPSYSDYTQQVVKYIPRHKGKDL